MGILSKIFNFDNIGGKIKNLAKWSCWITILIFWIAAPIAFIALVADERTAYLCWIPFVGAIIGSVVVWIGSWVAYAFGEHIENVKTIRYNTTIIAQPIRNAEAEKTQQKSNKQPTSPPPIETVKDQIFPARTDISSKKAVVEGEYVSGRTYTEGDEVIFEGKKYICTVKSTVWSPAVASNQWRVQA